MEKLSIRKLVTTVVCKESFVSIWAFSRINRFTRFEEVSVDSFYLSLIKQQAHTMH